MTHIYPTFLSFCSLCSTGIEISNITVSLKWKQQPPQSEIMRHSKHTFIHFSFCVIVSNMVALTSKLHSLLFQSYHLLVINQWWFFSFSFFHFKNNHCNYIKSIICDIHVNILLIWVACTWLAAAVYFNVWVHCLFIISL